MTATPSLFATRTAFAPSRPAADLVRDFRCPRLPAAIDHALIRRPERSLDRPVAFAGLADLAAAVHRGRGEAAIELRDVSLLLRGEDEPRPGVSVWVLSEEGERVSYLGWAYLAGGRRRELQDALFAAQPRAWAA